MPDHRPLRGIRGEYVYLRPLEPEDAETVHSWYEDTRIQTLMGDPPRSLAFRRQRYETAVTVDGDTVFRFMICLLDDDRAVGRADLYDIDRQNGSAGFGITIGDPNDWGQGMGSDAVNAIVDFAFGQLRLERVWLETAHDNERAQAVYEKAGFVREGVLRHSWFEDGRWLDDIRMAMLRDEWLALPRKRSWDLVAEAIADEPGSAT